MRRVLILLTFTLLASCLFAQPDALASHADLSLGHSVVALPGPWKFEPGDSPVANGKVLWASPDFDDSSWTNMDLHPKANATDAAYGGTGYLTGWTARGFPRLIGFAWYRIRVHIVSSTDPLWLKMPDHVDDSYQVFANGQFLGQFGNFKADQVVCYRSRPLSFALPPPDAHGNILLAFRFYMEPWVLSGGSSGDSGGMHDLPLLGLHSQIEAIRAQEVTGRLLSIIVSIFVAIFMLIAAAAAFWLWLFDRARPTCLWLALGLVGGTCINLFPVGSFFTYAWSQGTENTLIHTLAALILVGWILFWRGWFDLPARRSLKLLLAGLIAVGMLSQFAVQFSTHFTPGEVLFDSVIAAASRLVLVLVLFATLVEGARKNRFEALIAIPPVILLTISIFSSELIAWFHLRTSVFPFGVQITIMDVAHVLLVLVIAVLVARRFVGTQVAQRLERQAIEQDLQQARELQQHVLVPEPIRSDCFSVESAYYPAQTVGGDFFQTILHPDGSLLIVLGDVSGKGITAAMLVAVLVGAIRTRADETFHPAAMLQTLNDRLLGRAGGHFATCIAAHLRTDGTMQIANAGHLPPYRNGQPIAVAGSLPLGLCAVAEYEEHALQLHTADHLIFLTDGVIEARDAAGQLLGFDHANSLAELSPEAIARAAIAFGQDDDITILGVTFKSTNPRTTTAGRHEPIAIPA